MTLKKKILVEFHCSNRMFLEELLQQNDDDDDDDDTYERIIKNQLSAVVNDPSEIFKKHE